VPVAGQPKIVTGARFARPFAVIHEGRIVVKVGNIGLQEIGAVFPHGFERFGRDVVNAENCIKGLTVFVGGAPKGGKRVMADEFVKIEV
jgi:hypothetical protein